MGSTGGDMNLLLALLLAASAQEATHREETTTKEPDFDNIVFSIKSCDGVRAEFVDERPVDAPRLNDLFVEIRNATDGLCMYRGVVLKGALQGTYSTNRPRREDGSGFFLAAGESVRIFIKPGASGQDRSRIRLEIAPDRGTILLKAGPAEPPPSQEP